ncbi:MAG: type II toxin-antitoxin system VapC family toxin [Coriobacteriia bacterium]|nr:type II toxin-antitoxin system VapC family toxin [Coriobacteriia bacterium]
MTRPVYVLDASVGVKWFRDEPGCDDARDLLRRYGRHEILIAVDALFFYEVLRASTRDRTTQDALRIWGDLARLNLIAVPLGNELVTAAVKAREHLGCTLYDAFSAGLADLLDARLYSADARAHGSHPRVELIA